MHYSRACHTNLVNSNVVIGCRLRQLAVMTRTFSLLTLVVALAPAHAFEYDSYRHYSHANCSTDREDVPPRTFCDIQTGADSQTPKNLTGVVVYTHEFSGTVYVCARNLHTWHFMCDAKNASDQDVVVFDKSEGDLAFNWSVAGSAAPWWNWVMSIQLWDTDRPALYALRGYKTFFKVRQ